MGIFHSIYLFILMLTQMVLALSSLCINGYYLLHFLPLTLKKIFNGLLPFIVKQNIPFAFNMERYIQVYTPNWKSHFTIFSNTYPTNMCGSTYPLIFIPFI